nr:replication factor A protein 1-like [Ipomoea batatas]
MPSQYVSAHELSHLHTRRAMRLRLVRTYEVPEKRGGNVMRSKECLFHDDKELFEIYYVFFLGEVRITSSYDATKLWINHSFAEFAEFRSKYVLIPVLFHNTICFTLYHSLMQYFFRLAAENSPHRSITTTTVLSDSTGLGDLQSGSITITTLSDLLMKEEIVGIEGSRKGDWYYTSCMSQGCNKKLSEGDQGLLICGKCKKKWDQGCVRYKVVVRVVDKRDDAPFLLWDRECADLVGVPASLLFEKYLKEDIDIPPELESLIGRSMIFKLSLKRDQMRGPTSAYNVMRVITDQALVDEYCSRLNDTQEKDLISRMIEEDDDDSFDSDEEGSKGDEVNSPVNATQEKGKEMTLKIQTLSKGVYWTNFLHQPN